MPTCDRTKHKISRKLLIFLYHYLILLYVLLYVQLEDIYCVKKNHTISFKKVV